MQQIDDIVAIKGDVAIIRVFVEEIRADQTRFWEDHEDRLRTLEHGTVNSNTGIRLEGRVRDLEVGQEALRTRVGIFSSIAATIGLSAAAISAWLGAK